MPLDGAVEREARGREPAPGPAHRRQPPRRVGGSRDPYAAMSAETRGRHLLRGAATLSPLLVPLAMALALHLLTP